MDERDQIEYLRRAGCKCVQPLLGYRPGEGPRCRLCNTVARVNPDPMALDGIKMKVAEIVDIVLHDADFDQWQSLCFKTGMSSDELADIHHKVKAYLGDT